MVRIWSVSRVSRERAFPRYPAFASSALVIALACACIGFTTPLAAVPAPETSALPILYRHCSRCHTEEKRKGGLEITSRESILRGGDSGPIAAPGQSGGSLLIETLFPEAEIHMPPKGQLNPEEIIALEHWIDEGLPWDPELWEDLQNSPWTAPVDLTPLPPDYRPIFAMALSPEGDRMVVARGNQLDWYRRPSAEESDAESNALVREKSTFSGPETIQSLAWSPDGLRIAVGSFRRISLWEAKTQTLEGAIEEELGGRITALSFRPDSSLLLAADSQDGASGKLLWIDLESLAIQKTVQAHGDAVLGLDLNREGSLAASASADQSVKIWSLDTGELQSQLEGHTGYVLAVSFSPEGERLATGGDDEQIKIWRLSTGKQVASFGGSRTGPITGLHWTLDPKRIKEQAEESDAEKAKAINTDRIIAINEAGQPRAYTTLVEHEGAQRSTGARETSLESAEKELSSLVYDEATHGFFSGSPLGELFGWTSDGKLAYREREPSL